MPPPSLAQCDPGVARRAFLPYGRQQIDDGDVAAVVAALRAPLITTGPRVEHFEARLAETTGAAHAVAVSSGTAALHAAMYALGVGPGDEVIVPALTFAATASAVVFQGGTPVFADVEPDTLLVGPPQIRARLTPRTKAIVTVDYAGQPCDYASLRAIAARHGLPLLADACHALGGAYRGRPVGSVADLTVFSFHPVKAITTGEGGALVTADSALAERARRFRNHGISSDCHQRQREGAWFYEIVDLGFNYRITDLQCALGLSQLDKLSGWIERRQALARHYDEALRELPGAQPLAARADVSHAYHLYVIQLDTAQVGPVRAQVFTALRARGIGVNVHYIPVHLHPFYRQRFGTGPGLCPIAEAAYERILSLPLFPAMTERDVDDVVAALRDACQNAGGPR